MPDGDTSVEKALPGTFAAFSLAPRSAAILAAWAEEQGIPNPVPPSELHLTTVYSRDPVPAYSPNGLPGMLLLPTQFGLEMFGKALVLTVQADWLQDNHAHAMLLGASHDFPAYRPHITLSYDAAGFDITFGAPTFALRLGEERVEELRKSLRAMADIARIMDGIEKAKGDQPRVPAGNPKGGQFTTGAGTGMVSGVNAPQLGIAEGFNAATENPYPTRVPRPTDPEHNSNPDDVAVWVKGHDPGQLDEGPRFERWVPPADWSRVDGQMPRLDEDIPLMPVEGKSIGSGVIIREPDGRIWMVEPTNHYGGYRNTFPKGTQEAGLSLQANAIKETYEESGLKVRITGHLGDYERTTSVARFYLAERESGTPVGQGPESQAVKLVPLDAARDLANVPIDQKILDDYSRLAGGEVRKAGWVSMAVHAILAKIKGPDGYNRWPAGSSKGGEFAPKGGGGGGGSKGKVGAGGAAAGAGGAPAAVHGAFQPTLMTGKNPNNSALVAANKAIGNYAVLANKGDVAGLAALLPPDPSTQASGGNGYTKAKFAQWQAAMTHALALSSAPVKANTGTDQTPMKLSTMTLVGQKPGGSAAGGVFQDADGQKWLVKSYNSSDQARNEVLAANLYKTAGIDAPEMRLVDLEGQFKGGVGVASKWEDQKLSKFDATSATAVDKAQEGFAVDAWLSNWDVVGLENDNLLSRPDGSLVRIDPGGALLYRAQGSLKGDAFGDKVGEWDSLRGIGPNANIKAAQAFAAIPPAKMAESAIRVTSISDDTIRAVVTKYGPGDDAAKAALADKLIARKADIAQRAAALGPVAAKEQEQAPAVAAVHAIEKPAAAAPTISPDKPGLPSFEGGSQKFYVSQMGKIIEAADHSKSMPPFYVPVNGKALSSSNYLKYKEFYKQTALSSAAAGTLKEPPTIAGMNGPSTLSVGLKNIITDAILNSPYKVQSFVTAETYAFVAAKMVEMGKGGVPIGALTAKEALKDAPLSDIHAQTGFGLDLTKDQIVQVLSDHGTIAGTVNAAAKQAKMTDPETPAAGSGRPKGVVAPPIDDDLVNVGTIEGPVLAPVPDMPAAPMAQGLKLPNYEAVKLPESNTNAGTFNAQVTKLAGLAAAGDVKGILNSTYGTNTYGKKLAALANDTLLAMGHPATVKAGMNTKADPAKGTYQLASGYGGAKSAGLEAKDMAQAAPTPKAVAAANKPPFNASALMQPPDFTNWQGSGKGLSSSAHVNEANTAAAKALHTIASTGDEKALKAATFYEIDKATGLPTGAQKSFSQHPSNQVRQYYNALLEEIHEQKYSGQPFSVTAGGKPIDHYNKLYPAAVSPKGAAQMLGMYVVSGQTDGPPVVRGKVSDLSQAFIQKANNAWGAKSSEARNIAQSYIATHSAKSMNTQLRAGKESITANGKSYKREQFKAMMGELSDVYPPGTKLYRRMSSDGGAGSAPLPKAEWDKMIGEIKSAKPGQILTELGFTSTSHGSGVFNGNLEWRFTTAPGFKAISLFTLNPGEKEVLLPPGTRYHIQGWKEVGGKLLVDAVLLPAA